MFLELIKSSGFLGSWGKQVFHAGRKEMSQKYDGKFSANLFSLQLQLKTLLEEVGGDHALSFLDALTNLHGSEQKAVLAMFERVVKKVASGEMRFPTNGDLALKEFEDTLYNDLVGDLSKVQNGSSTSKSTRTSRKLEVVKGGAGKPRVDWDAKPATKERTPIDLAQARKERKLGPKSLLN